MNTASKRPISSIAADILRDWKNPYFGAVPYLRAMTGLHSATDSYGCDSADSIVRYFLANANTYRGENARTYKAELKAHVK